MHKTSRCEVLVTG